MNNINLILDSIKEDAKTEANDILSKAKEQGQEIIKSKEEDAKKEAEDMILSAQNQAELLIKNSEITANREARDIKIKAQNDVVTSVLEGLKEKLKNISDQNYKKYVLNSLKKMDVKNSEILLQDGKKDLFTQVDLNNLKISEETVEEGFVVRKGKIEYDSRFSSLIDYKKDELERQVIEKIFKWGD